ncbi:Piso0_005425 [Millerozyma farinosa CBS 7064]|uniref:Piso0_005425 protein n=1 Tax=Pichia sorbitophila (strain ATCC MYA-4447 / BCRC 22081 / CBS 7064 / NBRC 10061 / NRRL Y-12695) TaxID=559304 RepID=G8Y526_PICSO|nr:Piso0_005425 [Millerozyma farinosa CBS 7064]
MGNSTETEGSKSPGESQVPQAASIAYEGDSNEYVILGNAKYKRSELMEAFGGALNPEASPYPVHKFANPAPLGLAAFAFTTFVLSLYNAQAMGITVPNVVVSAATFYGGAMQFMAGVWELALGNTFGATALCSYGSFWLSYAAILIKSFNIGSGYGDDKDMLANATGFFLLSWAIFTLLLVLVTMKSTVAFCSLFFFLFLTFVLLAAGEFSGKVGVTRAGGVVGVITAVLGWYNAYAGAADRNNTYLTVKPILLPGAKLQHT